MQVPPFIEKLTVRNFRSLRDVTVTFANPTFFVGKNASGKSNFIDAFAFLSECMNRSLTSALEERGGIRQLGYILMERSAWIEFRVDFCLDSKCEARGHYAFALEVVDRNSFRVVREQGSVAKHSTPPVWFDRTTEDFRTNIPGIRPYLTPQQLALPIVGGTDAFAPLMQKLMQMYTYALDADVLRSPTRLDSGSALNRKGSNIASVLARFQDQERLDRVNALLRSIVPNLQFEAVMETTDGQGHLLFKQDLGGFAPVVWDASRLSNGTLKALGLEVTLIQEPTPSLIALEEPETDIYPGSLDAIAEKIDLVSQRSQVIVTTHSPDLLDTKWIEPKHLRVVQWEQGTLETAVSDHTLLGELETPHSKWYTTISELGNVPFSVLKDHLMGAGELLRANALDAASPTHTHTSQSIFEELS
jgi:predicted ATPase